jgi:hypothetical protein
MAALPSSSIASALGGGTGDLTQLLTVLLPIFAGILPGSVQNQEQIQQQASQRQLSASDTATNTQSFLQQIAGLLGGTTGAATNSGGITGALQAAIQKFTTGNQQNLTNNVWEQEQPQLAAAGLSQAPGIAASELSTSLAPYQIQERQLGATEGQGAVSSALNTEESNLQFPFNIGNAATSFPSFATL